MQFTTALLSVAALSTAAFAAPVEERTTATYQLKTVSTDSRFNNLFLEGYHTGAGFNDISLSPDAPSFYFHTNGTQIQTDFGEGGVYGLDYAGNTMYDEWYPSTLNTGYGSTGYSFYTYKGQSFLQNTGNGEAGWIACRWAHAGVPQLFETVVPNPVILSNCATVNVTQILQ